MIKGRFDLTELKRDWTDNTNIRICMEIGTEENYKNQVESIRWYKNGDTNSFFEVQSLIDKSVNYNDPDRAIAGQFCKKAISDVSFENLGYSGVETAEQTYDRDAKKISIAWTRPFDVSSDNSLTLEAGKSYNVFITWVTANKDGSKFNS